MARDVIHEWNSIHSESRGIVLMPVGWETHSSPLLGDRPQAIINEQVLVRSDLLVAIFWTRLGTATGHSLSGTVEEVERHMNSGRPAMLYFSAAPVVPDSVDLEQFRALQDFKKAIRSRGLTESYESNTEFKEKFARQLAQVLNTHSCFEMRGKQEDPIESSIAQPTPVDPNPIVKVDALSRIIEKRSNLSSQVSPDAAELLVEAAKDEGGLILRVGTMEGLEISTNNRNFNDDGGARSEARWEEALEELIKQRLIRDKGNKGEVFGITKLGYQVVDSLGG
ncbi:MAG TPA: DUF4062 domain-containing protein [Thermoanaerobaculia bacterium]|nr:DUF4062 domain-containing protein [Thermoanaerobaculia bacterium]